jgi:hypothetical protein
MMSMNLMSFHHPKSKRCRYHTWLRKQIPLPSHHFFEYGQFETRMAIAGQFEALGSCTVAIVEQQSDCATRKPKAWKVERVRYHQQRAAGTQSMAEVDVGGRL